MPARTAAANGLDLLLRAAAAAASGSARRLRLLLVGEGAEKPRLMAARRGLGARATSRFLDPLPKPRLAALLAGSQIGVQCLGAGAGNSRSGRRRTS